MKKKKDKKIDVLSETGSTPEPVDPAGSGPAVDVLSEAGSAPAEEIERLTAVVASEQKLSEQNQNKFLRALADLENYKKRGEKEKALMLEFANEDLLLEMLPVVDNLERALEHTGGDNDNRDSLAHGVKLTIDSALAVFRKYGLKEIAAVGEKFDPELHHAISHEDAEGVAPDMVVKEFQKGYTLKGKLIRPSTVMVSKEPDARGDQGEGE